MPIVLALTLVVGGWLGYSTFYINHWPTDSYDPYIPTAAKLFEKPYLSQMHTIPPEGPKRLHMRGKEALIVGIAVMQRLWKDYESLYPNVFLLIIVTGVSAVSLYLIFRKIFDPDTGLLVYFIYTFLFWPYVYVLQGAHQPLAFMNFLCAALFILYGGKNKFLMAILSGIFLGLMLFSSPTAGLYLVYVLGLLIWLKTKDILVYAGLTVGAFVVFLLFTLPDPAASVRGFFEFIRLSQQGNNIVGSREELIQFMTLPPDMRGGGMIWVWRYFILIMPILFPVYLVCLVLALKHSFTKPSALLVILLSLSTVIAVETVRVAQFGRNYFAWLPGILLLVGYMFHAHRDQILQGKPSFKRISLQVVVVLALIGHIVLNVRTFVADVFPSVMATENIYQWLIKNNQDKVYTYRRHPYNLNFGHFLNNPKHTRKIRLIGINDIHEARGGYILVPPTTGRTIYANCRYGTAPFVDRYFMGLKRTPDFHKYVAASFKTLASSKIWPQEEETCTYLDLMLHGISEEDRRDGVAYLIDAGKF